MLTQSSMLTVLWQDHLHSVLGSYFKKKKKAVMPFDLKVTSIILASQ